MTDLLTAEGGMKPRTPSVYVRIRSEILEGKLAPNSKLNARELAKAYDSGLSPVREALNRLASESLVQHSENRGFAVSPVSLSELMDLTQARCWVNELGIRQSIAKGDDAWEELVLVCCHRLGRTPRKVPGAEHKGINPEWDRVHKDFHQALVAACGSPWLIETCSQLFDAAERYRSLARRAGVSRIDPRDEHQTIMTAAVERRADEAATLLIEHFQKTAKLVRKAVEGSVGTTERS